MQGKSVRIGNDMEVEVAEGTARINPQEVGRRLRIEGRRVAMWCRKFNAPHQLSEIGRILIDWDEFKAWFDRERPDLTWREKRAKAPRPNEPSAPGCIYFLRDPRDKGVVYVGLDHYNGKRIKDHLRKLRRGRHENWKLQKLHKELAALGLELKGEIVEAVLGFRLGDRERELIAYWRKQQGERLCNIAEGGDITVHAPETRAKLSEVSSKKWRDPEYIARWTIANEEKCAQRKGMTVAEWKEWKAQRERERLANVAARLAGSKREHEQAERKALFRTLTQLTHNGHVFVPLTHGRYAVVDFEDWHRVSEYRWSWSNKGKYGRAKTNLSQAGCEKVSILLPRFIMNAEKNEEVIALDGNPLNSTKKNLLRRTMYTRSEERQRNIAKWKENMRLHAIRTSVLDTTYAIVRV